MTTGVARHADDPTAAQRSGLQGGSDEAPKRCRPGEPPDERMAMHAMWAGRRRGEQPLCRVPRLDSTDDTATDDASLGFSFLL